MPSYALTCDEGHRSEAIQSFQAALPACPACGAATRKVPSSFGVSGAAGVVPPPERMPQAWKGTYRGDREYLSSLRRTAGAGPGRSAP